MVPRSLIAGFVSATTVAPVVWAAPLPSAQADVPSASRKPSDFFGLTKVHTIELQISTENFKAMQPPTQANANFSAGPPPGFPGPPPGE